MAMTDQELVEYYQNLLIIQYRNKPLARASVGALIDPAIANQIYMAVQNAYNLETAIGVQLDVIGKYVGASRSGQTSTGFVTLNDTDYRSLIKFAIIRNFSGSSMADIVGLLWRFFPEKIFAFDHQNMRMSFLIRTDIGSSFLIDLVISQGLLPVPMAVQQSEIVYAPIVTNFFGFGEYNMQPINRSPFNDYNDYHMDYPWLEYGSSEFAGDTLTTEDGDVLTTEDGDTIVI